MNIYRYQFRARCPNNGELIYYRLELTTDQIVMVEAIKTACQRHEAGFHEAIADALFAELGGSQIITATHHMVEIETRRSLSKSAEPTRKAA